MKALSYYYCRLSYVIIPSGDDHKVVVGPDATCEEISRKFICSYMKDSLVNRKCRMRLRCGDYHARRGAVSSKREDLNLLKPVGTVPKGESPTEFHAYECAIPPLEYAFDDMKGKETTIDLHEVQRSSMTLSESCTRMI